MNRKNLKIALLGVLGVLFSALSSFADCICTYVNPSVQDYHYWCCNGTTAPSPVDSGTMYMCANNAPAYHQDNQGQCTLNNQIL
jgi:hypothetical protein